MRTRATSRSTISRAFELGVSPKTAPDKSEFVELAFEKGVPVSLNGEKMKPAVLIAKLNEIGGRNGIGLYDVVENRLVGMKSRGVYETPGGTILYKAHEVLETLTLDKLTAHKKRELAITFGELVYDGQWFSPLRKALSAFVTSTQENVTGKVRLELYKGNMINAGVWSPYSSTVRTLQLLLPAATTSRVMLPVLSASMVCPPRYRLL